MWPLSRWLCLLRRKNTRNPPGRDTQCRFGWAPQPQKNMLDLYVKFGILKWVSPPRGPCFWIQSLGTNSFRRFSGGDLSRKTWRAGMIVWPHMKSCIRWKRWGLLCQKIDSYHEYDEYPWDVMVNVSMILCQYRKVVDVVIPTSTRHQKGQVQ